jgi:SAM-dependent methyltransferase
VTLHARAQDIEYKTFPGESFEFYHCAGCGILFIHPMFADRLGDIYPPNYYSFVVGNSSIATRVKERLDAAYFRRSLRKIPGHELIALDVGGGNGWLLERIKHADRRVSRTWVVDIDDHAQELARLAGHEYFLGRFEEFQSQERFDVILMLNLIEHVADPRAVLQKAHDLLSPDGQLFIKTPNFDALDARLFRHKSWAGYHCPRHFVLFQRESLTSLCNECGLSVAAFSYTQGAPFWSVSVLDLLQRMKLAHISAERPAMFHPLMPLLQVGFAGFDFLRRPFSKLSQMQLVLQRKGADEG